MYAQAGFIEGPGHYGVDADMVAAAGDMRVYASLVHCREAFLGALDEYVRDGSNYDYLDADVVDGIFVQLADAYGWNLYEKFFSAFWPPNASFAFEVDTEAEQATMLVAALSAAADADLRPLFRDQWGFPADDGFYETAMPLLRERIRWRGEDFHWIFDDVPPSHLAFREIAAIADATIARGYSASPPTYSPHLAVTRNQMAVYVSRSMAGADTYVPPGPIVPHFVDVPSDDVCYKYIEYAVANEVVFGYPDGLYHPEYEVDRGQMAVFIARATATPTGEPGMVDYTPPATPTFADVTADPLDPYQACYKYVEYIAEQGVTHGYPDGLYHPEYIVSRGLMAIYVARAFQLPM